VALEEEKVYNIPLDSSKTTTMQVKIIDANHCPGSCMFLLEVNLFSSQTNFRATLERFSTPEIFVLTKKF
jgi:hypothetical protein